MYRSGHMNASVAGLMGGWEGSMLRSISCVLKIIGEKRWELFFLPLRDAVLISLFECFSCTAYGGMRRIFAPILNIGMYVVFAIMYWKFNDFYIFGLRNCVIHWALDKIKIKWIVWAVTALWLTPVPFENWKTSP